VGLDVCGNDYCVVVIIIVKSIQLKDYGSRSDVIEINNNAPAQNNPAAKFLFANEPLVIMSSSSS
jgi:hypothetical protein